MAQKHAFGKLLAQVRLERSYPTAYAFFRSRGGRRGLDLTFPNYLSLERGENLPKGKRLKLLLDALGLLAHSPARRKLVRTYLEDLVGSEDLLTEVFDAKAGEDPAPASLRLAETASQRMFAPMRVQFDLNQFAALAKDPTAYAANALLCNTEGGIELKALASRLKVAPPKLRKSLELLKSVGMARLEGSKAASAYEKSFIVAPTPTPTLAAVYAKLAAYRAQWVKDHGSVIHSPYLVMRARKGEMAKFLEHLTEAVNLSVVYSEQKLSEDSEFYMVEGRVTRLFSDHSG